MDSQLTECRAATAEQRIRQGNLPFLSPRPKCASNQCYVGAAQLQVRIFTIPRMCKLAFHMIFRSACQHIIGRT